MGEGELPDDHPKTALAEDRTILANERTFAGWMRTGLAAVGIGVGFHVLFREIEPSWVPRAIATLFLALAILIVLLAERRAAAVIERLDTHVIARAKRLNMRLIAWAVVTGTAALMAAIWLLELR